MKPFINDDFLLQTIKKTGSGYYISDPPALQQIAHLPGGK